MRRCVLVLALGLLFLGVQSIKTKTERAYDFNVVPDQNILLNYTYDDDAAHGLDGC